MANPKHGAVAATAAALLLQAPAVAQLPTPLSRFSNLPCLAPIIRAVDPAAPKNIGEALLLPPYRPLDPPTGIGHTEFPISGADAATQAAFDQGVTLLHHFADRAAERSFRDAASLAPEHAMPYWGLAMANERHPGRAAVYARYALHLAGRQTDLSPRERSWVELCHRYFAPDDAQQSDVELRRARVRALEDLAFAQPDDIETRAFLLRALVLDEYRAGIAVGSHFAVDALAGVLLADRPHHPAANYRPLLWLRDRPQRAASFALLAPAAAPRSPGAWRVAAESLAAAGDYHQALGAQDAALRLDFAQLRADFAMPDEEPDFVAGAAAHIETLITTGQTGAAADLARHLISLPRTAYLDPKRDRFETAQSGAFMTGRRMLASALMRGARWSELHSECSGENGAIQATESWTDRAHTLYWRAIAEWHLGQPATARATGKELESLFRRFLGAGTTLAVEKEIAKAIKSLRAYAALFETAPAKAPTAPLLHLTKAQLASVLASRGARAAGFELAREDLSDRPGQPEAVATFCALGAAAGRVDEALPQFDTAFRRNASLADRDHPLFSNGLKPMVERLRLRGNWTLPAQPRERPASLPAATELGAARWSPPAAPAFDLPLPQGGRQSLAELRGRPVLLIFFVGVGCAFCVEQLKVFEPESASFAEAGIPILTVSTDSLETLRTSLSAARESDPDTPAFPFPILADPTLETFRAYRCFDSFNNKALHGIYLLNPDGEILWDNISHEPFLYPQFLLAESRRLLSLWSGGSAPEKQ